MAPDKTTSIRMLTGQLRPTSGYARVAGCDVITDSDQMTGENFLNELGFASKVSNRKLMNSRVVAAFAQKDIVDAIRNRSWALLTPVFVAVLIRVLLQG